MSEGLISEFVVAAEFVPPFSPDPNVILNLVKKYQESGVKAVSISSNPAGRPKLPALYAADLIGPLMKRIVHYPCSGRSSVIFQSDMMSAVNMGVEAVLVTRGDLHPECSMDVDVVKRIALLRNHPASESLLIGAAVNPNEVNMARWATKKAVGADFFQTLPIFDVETLFRFADVVGKLETPTLVGIVCPHSRQQLELMKEIPGVLIPERYSNLFNGLNSDGAFQANAVAEAHRLIEVCEELFAGVDLMLSPSQLPSFLDVFEKQDAGVS